MIIGIVVVMTKIDAALTLIALCVIPVLYISIKRFTPRIENESQSVEESTSHLYSFTTEAIENVQLTQSFNAQKKQLSLIERLLKHNFTYQMKYLVTNERYSLTNDVIAASAMALLVILGADRVYTKGLTVGDLLVFLTYLSYLYGPLQTISDSISDARRYIAASKRVYQLHSYDTPLPHAPTHYLQNVKGKIEFINVSSAYKSHNVLHNITLTIEPGEKIGIIGRSGVGKTTLLNLLPRFGEYNQGTIKIDSIQIDTLSLSNLREQFAIVSQDTLLFNTSILNNLKIACTDDGISMARIMQAALDANAYEFIKKLPDGFDTIVGEHGRLLSGGQKQRIAIARGFLKNAPILLLDEPSTGLDEESVSIILDALQKLMAHRTTLIVSHSLEILKKTDSIYMLDKGQIAAKTTYQELINDYMYGPESAQGRLTIFREGVLDRTRAPLPS